MINNRETGILVPHDNENKFISTLVEFIDMDFQKREKIGQNALDYVIKTYSIKNLALKHANIYLNLGPKLNFHNKINFSNTFN